MLEVDTSTRIHGAVEKFNPLILEQLFQSDFITRINWKLRQVELTEYEGMHKFGEAATFSWKLTQFGIIDDHWVQPPH
jgi:hypothetical protein